MKSRLKKQKFDHQLEQPLFWTFSIDHTFEFFNDAKIIWLQYQQVFLGHLAKY